MLQKSKFIHPRHKIFPIHNGYNKLQSYDKLKFVVPSNLQKACFTVHLEHIVKLFSILQSTLTS